MNSKKLLTNIAGWSVVICFVVIVAFIVIQFIPALIELSQLGFYPERVPFREVASTKDFSFVWSTKTNDGSQHLVYTQIFVIDDKSIIYITPNSMNSIDFLTGDLLWSTEIPEDSVFHFYDGKLFSLDSYDTTIPFAADANIEIPSKCNSSDQSTMRVYNPHTGKKEWEYSYQMVYPEQIFFEGNSAFIDGMTISSFSKYISVFEVDINSGQILGVDCQNYNKYTRTTSDEGTLSSGYSPITRDWEWARNTEMPAFITDGSKLVMVNRQTRQPIEEITFSGFSLNPAAVTLIFQNNLLVVYLDDSNQFFAFQKK